VNALRSVLGVSLLLAGLQQPALAERPGSAGKQIFEERCAGCHRGASPSSATLGPSLAGLIGRKAGTGASGVHSRAVTESGIVWTRNSLRRYLSDPAREIPGTIMPVRVQDPKELELLLDYLETMR
jgi:cytochrome c